MCSNFSLCVYLMFSWLLRRNPKQLSVWQRSSLVSFHGDILSAWIHILPSSHFVLTTWCVSYCEIRQLRYGRFWSRNREESSPGKRIKAGFQSKSRNLIAFNTVSKNKYRSKRVFVLVYFPSEVNFRVKLTCITQTLGAEKMDRQEKNYERKELPR